MRRGEVVEIDWHFSDLTGSKVRPAVVVQADFLDGLSDDTILVKITGRRYGIPGTEGEIDPTVEWASGLSKLPSFARPEDARAVAYERLEHRIGAVAPGELAAVRRILRVFLDL